ncbi:2-succinyl-6-hydroxy-2,4-cyclohexadiene-1-carboxylate synthase [Solibacillus sp. CAU 1738]|uniref:2-succinyl-6-hydroxy-2, 4-cyclohexadiene-1-carboxylate synthase n=1 Tax=Solibacillus sp. CAU 1738 TaxID=3140363 RepID=UPI00326099E7
MVTEVNGIKVNVDIWNEQATHTIVCLHGFTGSTKTWEQVAKLVPARIVAVDLIGHGQTAAPSDVSYYSMEVQVELLEALFEQLTLSDFTLLGYSMGGRVALSYVTRYPTRIQALILESASPGLASNEERMARKQADEMLANNIEQNGIESFVSKWEDIPLFASQKNLPVTVQREIRQERLSQCEIGLANSLRGMGTGVMPQLWDALSELSMPVLLITGSLDTKFVGLSQQMAETIPNVKNITVAGAGHAIHVENPVEFATIVKDNSNIIRG